MPRDEMGDTLEPVSDRIREARRKADLRADEVARRSPRQRGPLTQAELAVRMGVSREEVNHLENGRRGVGSVMACRLAKALGGDPADWIEDSISVRTIRTDLDEISGQVMAMAAQLRSLEDLVQRLAGSPPEETDSP